MNLTLKSPWLWISTLFLIAFAYFYSGFFYPTGDQQHISSNFHLPAKNVKQVTTDSTGAIADEVAIANEEGESVIHIRDLDRHLNSLPTVGGEPHERAVRYDWMNAQGYNKGRDNEYKNYSEDTLRLMAEGGDIYAMVEYGYHLMRRPGGVQSGEEWFINAMVYGSLEAFLHMSISVRSNMHDAETPEQMRSYALESLAWYEAAALRGNKELALIGATSFVRSNEIQLDSQDVQWLQARAQEIYNDLAARRTAAGLSEFDNSVPQVVEDYFKRLSVFVEREELGLPPL